jgi:hypothetical protein
MSSGKELRSRCYGEKDTSDYAPKQVFDTHNIHCVLCLCSKRCYTYIDCNAVHYLHEGLLSSSPRRESLSELVSREQI